MCGFVGFTNRINQAEDVLRSMMEKITHRGPDSDGVYVDSEIALGFRRLSIIDLSGGDQPIFNEDNTLVLLFNGEVYNYQELRETLLAQGHKFSTHSDSEVVLHAYEQYGSSFVNQLRGMFAFVIWDKQNQKLFGARDMFGIKPLYYSQMGDSFLFGSEVKSFLPHPNFRKQLNTTALESYLSFQYSVGPESFFKGVFRLPPAHYFFYENGKVSLTRYWMPNFHETSGKTLEEWTDAIEQTFDDSIQAHKVSDVEVGAFLSSGVDSSYVVCSANVDKTFTVGFSQHKYNEINYAQELSKYIGVKNISKVITPEEFWEKFPEIQYHMDEPLADPAAAALYFVCNTASKYVKVVLSGEGADEIFGGYNVYKDPVENAAYDKIPYAIRHAIGRLAGIFPAHRGLNFFVRHGQRIEDRFIGNAYIFSEKERNRLLKNVDPNALSPAEICRSYYDHVKDKDSVTKMQFIDLNLWMVGDILLKADRMSMANSLELRVPFLDRKVMELAEQIPTKYRVNRENTKYALRQAALRRMPKQVADKKKLGFPVPTRVWLRQEQYARMVREKFESPVAKEYFHTDELLKLLNQHQAGKKDNSRKIWTIYTFLVWYDQYFSESLV